MSEGKSEGFFADRCFFTVRKLVISRHRGKQDRAVLLLPPPPAVVRLFVYYVSVLPPSTQYVCRYYVLNSGALDSTRCGCVDGVCWGAQCG